MQFIKRSNTQGLLRGLLFVAVSACSSLPHVVEPSTEHTSSVATEIFVVSHGWHTGIVVPSGPIQARLPALQQRFNGAKYIELGWGDKGFYQAKKITSGLSLRAIFWPTESILHVVAVPKDPAKYFPNSDVVKLCLNANEYASLIQFLENSFHKDGANKLVKLGGGLYGDAQFYQSMGEYYLMNTCNKWTAKGLKSAGLDISPLFKLTASSVMDNIKETTHSAVNGSCEAVPANSMRYLKQSISAR